MVYVTNDVVDLAPTVLVPKVNVNHDFYTLSVSISISVYVSGSLSELMQVYVHRLLVSNMQVNGGFYARLRVCMRVSTDTLGVVDGYHLWRLKTARNSEVKTGFNQGI